MRQPRAEADVAAIFAGPGPSRVEKTHSGSGATKLNTQPDRLNGARVLVVGLGRFGGGVGVTKWLAMHGADVTVTDLAPPSSLAESLAAIAEVAVTLRLAGHDGVDPGRFDVVVVNPAVNKRHSPFFKLVAESGVTWTTELNLFCERCPAKVIGVTGTYGKSTTCAMLAHVLEKACAAGAGPFTGVHLGGNIGRSLLTELPNIRAEDIVVLEMSNAQLEDLPRIEWTPAVAVITNLFPHHLDRYDSFTDYASAKLNIVSPADPRQPVIVGELTGDAVDLLRARVSNNDRRITRVQRGNDIRLAVAGKHNRANADCVLTIAETLGVGEGVCREALAEFSGLPHRLEHVRRVGGVEYVNDSKSTAPAATVTAIQAILERNGSAQSEASIVAIVGGQQKDIALADFPDWLAGSCRAVIGIGEAGPAFGEAARQAAQAAGRNLAVYVDGELDAALQRARSIARAGDVVLFSPGAPSFDRYGNFTERGRHFVELVTRL